MIFKIPDMVANAACIIELRTWEIVLNINAPFAPKPNVMVQQEEIKTRKASSLKCCF